MVERAGVPNNINNGFVLCKCPCKLHSKKKKKSKHFHHSPILKQYQILSWDGLIKYANLCLGYKVSYDLAPLPLLSYINRTTNTNHVPRGSVRGDWTTQSKHIRKLNTYRSFSNQLKQWLIHTHVSTKLFLLLLFMCPACSHCCSLCIYVTTVFNNCVSFSCLETTCLILFLLWWKMAF